MGSEIRLRIGLFLEQVVEHLVQLLYGRVVLVVFSKALCTLLERSVRLTVPYYPSQWFQRLFSQTGTVRRVQLLGPAQ